MTSADQPTLAVIGGSGFYEFLDDVEKVEVDTPYGAPSGPVAIGEVGGRRVAFLPRHGAGHAKPPHLINVRANIWALRSVGVRQVLAPCAVGGLQEHTQPGTLVVPDQLVDRTTGRVSTFVESGALHVPFADPYCPQLRTTLLKASQAQGEGRADAAIDGGAMVVIEGPRFSTRAESQWYAAQGWSLVNMTGLPEAALAREMGLCYAAIALVTDLDAGVSAEESVSQEAVFAMFAANIERLKGLIGAAVGSAPEPGPCGCNTWMDGIDVPYELP
jgi:5'-methylthioadenosine phosphorylase